MFSEAALVLVGDELLSGRTRDVNLHRFSGLLAEIGLPVVLAKVVRDVPREISAAVRDSLADKRVVIVTGGMGPTDDDLTVRAVADAFNLSLFRSPVAEEMVRKKQHEYGLGLPLSAFKQADIPEGASPVLNPAGIAPGIVLPVGKGVVICMPGVPAESSALLMPCLREAGVQPRRAKQVRFIRTWGLKENNLFDALRDLAKKNNIIPAFLPSPGRVDIKVSGIGADVFCRGVTEKLGNRVYSTLRDETLEEVLGRKLISSGYFLATAESCTGGGIGRGITAVAGASSWYSGGVITYSDDLKTGLLGVKKETLEVHGAVSKQTALEMARGVRRITGADCSLSVTGIAGPAGATDGKPVGTVWTAVCCGEVERAYLWRLGGDRESIRDGACARALGTLFELLS
ncbi:MAG: nicotinamide-nucleotide amidohydrolase family protein [Candidatus Sabulitectum sp.]|nr:nicotinamide-nucleotide amidohydrolase family protein [Candidatus Sabulitectum sp.]